MSILAKESAEGFEEFPQKRDYVVSRPWPVARRFGQGKFVIQAEE